MPQPTFTQVREQIQAIKKAFDGRVHFEEWEHEGAVFLKVVLTLKVPQA